MRFAARWLNYCLGAVLFAIAVYRAATMSLTIDEATTYVGYVHHGWTGIFYGPFDANNHILYSILEKLTRQWFGMSELSLRLPALLGAGLFLWSLARLCAMLTPRVWASALAFVVVAGNPLTLDFMAAARGYGLALGLLSYALWQWLEWMEDGHRRRVWMAAVALGLATSANLIFVVASIALFSVGVLFLIRRQRWTLIPGAVLPAVLIPLALWWVPFEQFSREAFYFGAPTMYAATESVELAVFVHDISRGDPFASWWSMYYLRTEILPLMVPVLWLGILFWARRRVTQGLAFTMLVFAVACFGTWLAHVWLGVLYPQERTALALVFLFLLSWTAAIGAWWEANRYTRWLLAFPNLLLALVFVMQFAGQFDTRYLAPWGVNWKMRDVMSEMRRHPGKLRTHWIYQSSAEYYRLRWKIPMEPVAREADQFPLDNAQYFLLPLPSQEEVAATGLRAIYRDELTGTTLLEKR